MKAAGRSLAAAGIAFAVIAVALGLLPAHSDFTPPAQGVTIYVSANGIHADLALPVAHGGIDWRRDFPAEHFAVDVSHGDYVAFGWGNRDFYEQTREWSDLKLGVVAKALVGRGASALHVMYAERERIASRGVAVVVTDAQYRRIASYVRGTLSADAAGRPRLIEGLSYWGSDAFYAAGATYNLVRTCNDWVRGALNAGGVRTPRWAPLAYPIVYQLRRAGGRPSP